jgi:hypothetical protein
MPCCDIGADVQVPVARLTAIGHAVDCATLDRLPSPVADTTAQAVPETAAHERPPGASRREVLRI